MALLLEARFNDLARRELSETLTKLAITGDVENFELFSRAMSLLWRTRRHGAAKGLKATVLMFILGRRFAGEPPPTRAETDRFIDTLGMQLGNDGRNLVRDIYSGPIAGYLARRVGRPRRTRRNSS